MTTYRLMLTGGNYCHPCPFATESAAYAFGLALGHEEPKVIAVAEVEAVDDDGEAQIEFVKWNRAQDNINLEKENAR